MEEVFDTSKKLTLFVTKLILLFFFNVRLYKNYFSNVSYTLIKIHKNSKFDLFILV